MTIDWQGMTKGKTRLRLLKKTDAQFKKTIVGIYIVKDMNIVTVKRILVMIHGLCQ